MDVAPLTYELVYVAWSVVLLIVHITLQGGLALNSIGGLTSLVADIAARGSPRNAGSGNRDANREGAAEKNATPARFRRENS